MEPVTWEGHAGRNVGKRRRVEQMDLGRFHSRMTMEASGPDMEGVQGPGRSISAHAYKRWTVECPAPMARQVRRNTRATAAASGAKPASAKFSSTCWGRLIPTSTLPTPGMERTNCTVRCTSLDSAAKAS